MTLNSEALEKARTACAASDFHDHDGCSCSDAELARRTALPSGDELKIVGYAYRGPRGGLIVTEDFPKHAPEAKAVVRQSEAATCIQSLLAENGTLEQNTNSLLEIIDLWKARVKVLEEALGPFAEAAANLDDNHADGSPIWESPAAMGIDAKHLRSALNALGRNGE